MSPPSLSSLFGNKKHQRVIPAEEIDHGGLKINRNSESSIHSSSLHIAASVIASLPVPVCLLDQHGFISKFNSSFANVVDMPERAFPIHVAEIITGIDKAEVRMGLARLMSGQSSRMDVNVSTKLFDNKKGMRWEVQHMHSLPFFIMTGTPSADLNISDLLEKYEEYSKKILDERLESAGLKLNKARKVKSSELSLKREFDEKITAVGETMQRFQVISQKLETKRKFVRQVSHEIRTPLNVVMSGLDLLSSLVPEMSSDASEMLQDMRSACRVAVDILNDLLTYEKLDADQLTLEKSLCDVLSLVEQVHSMFKIQAKQADLRLVLNKVTDASMILIEVDASKLSQVLRNLLSNAVKFTRCGGTISISVLLNASSDRVRIEVHDTGVGITKSDRKKLFNEFVQLNAKDLQGGGGSGLGLFLSRRIMGMHQGTIGVDLEWEGPGSIFFIELPVNSVNLQSSDSMNTFLQNNEGVVKTMSSSKNDRKIRILIVDDSALCRKFHQRMLSSLRPSLALEYACDGEEAIKAVEHSISAEYKFDAILMDSNMPFMNGLQASARIRKLGFAGLIFGVTGNVFQTDIDEFLAQGADEVLAKPVSAERYSHVFDRILNHHG